MGGWVDRLLCVENAIRVALLNLVPLGCSCYQRPDTNYTTVLITNEI